MHTCVEDRHTVCIQIICFCNNRNCGIFLQIRCLIVLALTKICVLVDIHCHRSIGNRKSSICTWKTMFHCIQADDLLFLCNTKSHDRLNDQECNGDQNSCIECCGSHTKQL